MIDNVLSKFDLGCIGTFVLQVPFLTGMRTISEIRTMFAAEVEISYLNQTLVFSADDKCFLGRQLLLKSNTRHFAEGSIIGDSHETSNGLVVITSGFVNVELPMDSEEADEENRTPDGKTLLFVFGRGYAFKVLISEYTCC
jgi:hypothetical protein